MGTRGHKFPAKGKGGGGKVRGGTSHLVCYAWYEMNDVFIFVIALIRCIAFAEYILIPRS